MIPYQPVKEEARRKRKRWKNRKRKRRRRRLKRFSAILAQDNGVEQLISFL